MSANIEYRDGKANFVYNGEVPWHRSGTPISNDLSTDEVMRTAGLDWRVNEVPTFAVSGDKMIPTGWKALVRDIDDKVLTQVGKNWHPVQNQEAFDFFKDFVEEGHMYMDTAGSLAGGRKVFALAKVKDSFFEVFGGDRTESYLLFTNPHEYGKTLDVRMTTVRVVCQNTLALSLKAHSSNVVKLNHSRKFDPVAVKEMMDISSSKMTRFKEIAEFLGSKSYAPESIDEYFGEVFGRNKDGKLSKNAGLALEYMHTQPGAEYAEGSFWQLFNTVSYMTNHVIGKSNDARMESAWYGINQKRATNALELALDMADAV